MHKIKDAIKGHRHHHDEDKHAAGTTAVPDSIVPGSVPVTGTYSRTEAEYQAAMRQAGVGTVSERTDTAAPTAVEERPVAVGVAEVPIVVTEQERVTGTHETHRTHTHHETHHTHAAGRVSEEVCGQKTFTEVEDRPVVRERVERIVEHRPVEKQYVVETRFVGEKEMGVAGAEIVDTKDRVVEVAQPGPTCPVNTGAIMNEAIGGVGHSTGTPGTGRV